MLLAFALWHNPNAPKEIALFHADWAAQQIAFEAVEIGCTKGRLGELCRQMENIKRREGLAEDEFWKPNEGPADYEAARLEWEAINGKIQQTVMLFAWRRYRLEAVADLYERDPARFAVMREAGRRMIFRGKAVAKESTVFGDGWILRQSVGDY